jgi:hypothetical protein
MFYANWIPADPAACAALLPPALEPAQNHAVYMNQYVVDSAEQTTGFGAYSLTYLGLDLSSNPTPDGSKPGRFFTHYFNSSEAVRAYVTERGVPATAGTTELTVEGDALTATTYVNGKPIIRSKARVSNLDDLSPVSGHMRYLTRVGDRLVSGLYPYLGNIAKQFEIVSIEFLDPSHPVYALRPRQPLEVITSESFYSPNNSFVYPGGEEDLGKAGA